MRSARLFLFGLGLVLLPGGLTTSRALQAQTAATGTVLGLVTDPSGAVVPGATISLTDRATGISRTAQSNRDGRYLFLAVQLGRYDLTVNQSGFRPAQIRDQQVRVGLSLTENVQLQLGPANQIVEVSPSPVAELQTLDASQGTTLSGTTALALPNLGRDASSLLLYQANTNPGCACVLGGLVGGEIGGAMRDQNAYMLDGGLNTSDTDGDGREYTSPGFSSNNSGSGVVPTPVESIEEIRVVTNNPAADYARASGGEIMMVTKRGTDQWHGSAYDYFQGDWLNANTWDNNRLGLDRQKNHQNRFGGSLGGRLLPDGLGGRTYFYANYEGWKFPQAQSLTTTVPSALLRQGILQFPDGVCDAQGNCQVEQYNLATSAACGPSGGLPCDPRGIGISPVVSELWNKYMPAGNAPSIVNSHADGLNTITDLQQVQFPQSSNSLALRVDHNFGSHWQWTTNYRFFRQEAPYAGSYDQVDWGGELPGDQLGTPSVVSRHPVQPRYLVTALDGQITPNLNNQFRFNYVRNWWAWNTGGVPQLIRGVPAGISVGGLDGMNLDWPSARQRTWNGHDWNYMDNLSWAYGNHLIQLGGGLYHTWIHFSRDDGSGTLTSPLYSLGSGGIRTSALYRPPSCTATLQTGCISVAPAQWDALYYETLGILSRASQLYTRSGPDFALQPQGSVLAATSAIDTYSLYASDTWHLTPQLTLSYGLNWGTEMPPVEQNGRQDMLVTADGTPVTATGYLATKQSQALAGENYNPVLGYAPVSAVPGAGKYPYRPDYRGFAPRLSAAWNPHFQNGWLRRVFGADSSVLRGGWSRIYDRANGSNLVIIPLQGVGFGQGVSCAGANSAAATGQPAACNGTGSQTAASGFRLGPDGLVAPLAPPATTLTTPILPGVNSAAVGNGDTISPDFRPAVSDQFTISWQRQLPGHTILELSWLGNWAHHEYHTVDLNNVPYMMTLGGQSFAKAYAGLAKQVLANPGMDPNAVTPQPFFEAALKAGPGNFCANYASCTAAVAATEGAAGSGNLNTQSVLELWNDLESHWVFGPALIQSQGLFGAELMSSNGRSTYNAGAISLKKRAASGLTLDGNFTWSHSLDDGAYVQASSGSQTVNPYDPHADYGDSLFDLRYIMNVVAVYDLPFSGSRHSLMGRALGGWTIAPILSFHSGDPLIAGGTSFEEFGEPGGNSVNDVASIPTGPIPAVNVHRGVQTNGSVGSANNIDPVNNPNGTQLNAFADPAAVLATFRPAILGQDGSRSTVFGYGPSFWNLDLNLRKDFQITERTSASLNLEMMNAFNHINWQDPVVYTQLPSLFGTIPGPANQPRRMELGLRLYW